MSFDAKKYHSIYYIKHREEILANQKEYYKKNPWMNNYKKAKGRCQCETNKRYHRYGGRGIKFLLSVKDIKFLWFRDKGYLMKLPSIDRIYNNGNYSLSNCRYIEFEVNRELKKTHCKRGHLLKGKNIKIRKDGYRECKLCMKARRLENGKLS